MAFKQALRDVVWVLLTEGRVSFQRLRHEFELNEEQLDALRFELVHVKAWATEEEGDVLTWARDVQQRQVPHPRGESRAGDAAGVSRPHDGPARR